MKFCKLCGGELALLGALGRTKQYRCAACGAQFSHTPRARQTPRQKKAWRAFDAVSVNFA